MSSLSVRQVIEKIAAGDLRIPAFQRGFVWDADRVASFMDSIYQGYPFGLVTIWRTREHLRSKRTFGPFDLPEQTMTGPVDYVLDGQQRLTSIFGVFQTFFSPSPANPSAAGSSSSTEEDWTGIYFDCSVPSARSGSQFVALPPEAVNPEQHFPIGTFFTTTEYRAATQVLTPECQARVDAAQSRFKEVSVPVQVVESDDRSKVAAMFERINRFGVRWDGLQLFSAWTGNNEFDLDEQISDLDIDLEVLGFETVSDDSDLLLLCCSAVLTADISFSGLFNLDVGTVRDRFVEVRNGIVGAAGFLKEELAVDQFEDLPFSTLLVPLAVFFARPAFAAPAYTAEQLTELCKWFRRACSVRRFAADVSGRLNRDIVAAKTLRESGVISLAGFSE